MFEIPLSCTPGTSDEGGAENSRWAVFDGTFPLRVRLEPGELLVVDPEKSKLDKLKEDDIPACWLRLCWLGGVDELSRMNGKKEKKKYYMTGRQRIDRGITLLIGRAAVANNVIS